LGGTHLRQEEGYWRGRFQAMACDCEIMTETSEVRVAKAMLKMAADEAWRIELKFSRYRRGNIVDQINHSRGKALEVDEETAQLLDFAKECYGMSEGLFDITSGVLRRLWRFDGSDQIPSQKQVETILPLVGWEKVLWDSPVIQLQRGMEIDFGGIGKEYAVDRILRLLLEDFGGGVLVNLGGDTAVGGARKDGSPWNIGIEALRLDQTAQRIIQIQRGAIASSGDCRRYLLKAGKRYSHILNPQTGWPVEGAPRSVTVAAGTCTEAGLLASLAMLHGTQAEAFLDEEAVRYWCSREEAC